MVIEEVSYLASMNHLALFPWTADSIRALNRVGLPVVVVTNQSGIARGYFDAARLELIHDRLKSMLATEGLRLEAIYVCPHGPDDGCDCRKPAPGMVKSAMRDLDFGPAEAVLIGDSDADMGAAAAVGVAGLRVASPGKSAAIGAAADSLEASRRACALLAKREGGQGARS